MMTARVTVATASSQATASPITSQAAGLLLAIVGLLFNVSSPKFLHAFLNQQRPLDLCGYQSYSDDCFGHEYMSLTSVWT